MDYLCRNFAIVQDYEYTTHLSEQEIIRREKLKELKDLGIEPTRLPCTP